jgi:hypothetical protein
MATEGLYLGGDRRSIRPWMVGLLLGLSAAVIVFWLTTAGGDRSSRPESSTSRLGATGQAPASIEQPADNVPGGGAVETSELFAPKDPFDPLISTSEGAGGRVAGASSKASRAQAGGERKVVLVAATSRRGGSAEVRVNGTSYTVAHGEIFADNFKLLAASGDCVAMLFGDQEFTLCEGDEILK